jgi:plastocyanin
VDVQLLASSFSPADVTVARGGTVRWVNAGDVAHTITPANAGQAGVWQNQNVPAQQNFAFSHTFPTAGTFNYSCTLHVGMTGVVRVP